MNDRGKRNAKAFTLVELLVVIAIIGILVSLLLPAVQSAREAARRTSCQNNLRNVALAMHEYHDSHDAFPPAMELPERFLNNTENTANGNRLFANWAIRILPFLEEGPLYDAFDFSPNIRIQDGVNSVQRGTKLSVMLCPSDEGADTPCTKSGGNWARGNYAINGGLDFVMSFENWWSSRPYARGIATVNRSINIAKIIDGTSKTILLGELRIGLSGSDRRGTWAMGLCGSSVHCEHASNFVRSPNSCFAGDEDIRDRADIVADVGEERLIAECMMPSTYNFSAQSVVRSQHPGGVYVAFADGGVRFISDYVETGAQTAGVDPDPAVFLTWQRLNSSADDLVINTSSIE